MFGFFKKNSLKKLEQKYSNMMTKAIEAQRNGNIRLYSEISFEADKILKKIESQKNNTN